MATEEITPESAPTAPPALTVEPVGESAGEAVVASAAATKLYPIAPGVELHVRSGPGVNYTIVRTLPAGTSVPIICQRSGDSVSGYYGTTNIWDCIGNAQFVSDAYVKTGSDGYIAPRCS
ncbi:MULTISPECIES: SH3 domain-containing protein [unclassified Streptomyces]|uniref:SH3 domain-containing protein n=1 Tax=unclassified Streptomyces TaxID=2593676 RepID=UPI0004BDF7D6|nr:MULTISPECIES: SH3 domain-containing protein [unclassified Streptomyces]